MWGKYFERMVIQEARVIWQMILNLSVHVYFFYHMNLNHIHSSDSVSSLPSNVISSCRDWAAHTELCIRHERRVQRHISRRKALAVPKEQSHPLHQGAKSSQQDLTALKDILYKVTWFKLSTVYVCQQDCDLLKGKDWEVLTVLEERVCFPNSFFSRYVDSQKTWSIALVNSS